MPLVHSMLLVVVDLFGELPVVVDLRDLLPQLVELRDLLHQLQDLLPQLLVELQDLLMVMELLLCHSRSVTAQTLEIPFLHLHLTTHLESTSAVHSSETQ